MQIDKVSYIQMLIDANGMEAEDFHQWIFRAEMTFKAPGKWWGDFGLRDFPHEGVDLCLYADRLGKIRRLDEQTKIPVMHDGVIKAVFKDYLGQAVIIEHASEQNRDGTFLSAYAHTVPLESAQPGVEVRRGDIIATIADTRTSKAKILPHLHLTFGRPSEKLGYESFVWDVMRDPHLVILIDPLELMDGPHAVMDIDLINTFGAGSP